MAAVKDLNLEQLEEKYGYNLVEKMIDHIKFAEENNIDYRIEVVAEDKSFTQIAFVTNAYAYNYEVSNKRKRIMSEDRIDWMACENIYKLMQSFKAE